MQVKLAYSFRIASSFELETSKLKVKLGFLWGQIYFESKYENGSSIYVLKKTALEQGCYKRTLSAIIRV